MDIFEVIKTRRSIRRFLDKPVEEEKLRKKIKTDPACQAAFAFAEKTRCIISYERSFMRPVFK